MRSDWRTTFGLLAASAVFALVAVGLVFVAPDAFVWSVPTTFGP